MKHMYTGIFTVYSIITYSQCEDRTTYRSGWSDKHMLSSPYRENYLWNRDTEFPSQTEVYD